MRAFTAVPGHALDGVFMGYFMNKAKFDPHHRQRSLILALAIPVLLHGIWDFLAFYTSEMDGNFNMTALSLLLFAVFIICLYVFGIRRINKVVEESQFKNNPPAD